MRPKLNAWLVIRTVGFLALFIWAGFSIFRVPGGSPMMRFGMGFLLSILCVETLVPLIRALPTVGEKADFALAAVQYMVVPLLGLVMLIAGLALLLISGELKMATAVKACWTGILLLVMILTFTRKTWKRYCRERDMSIKERLNELESAYEAGKLSRDDYQEKRERIYEASWKKADRGERS